MPLLSTIQAVWLELRHLWNRSPGHWNNGKTYSRSLDSSLSFLGAKLNKNQSKATIPWFLFGFLTALIRSLMPEADGCWNMLALEGKTHGGNPFRRRRINKRRPKKDR